MTGNAIEYATVTDVGLRRSQNQDSHAVLLARDEVSWRKHGHVFIVADGMGAHAVGELASELSTDIIPLTYQKYADDSPEQALQKAFQEANASIHERGQQNREFQGMGTTSTVLLLRPEGAWIGHVGDSRAYRIRDEQIEQLSFDHSLLWELARRQKVTPDRLQGVPSNVIVRSMGPEGEVEADIEGPHPLRAGDTFLLCSDGLSGLVTDHEIGVLAGLLPPAEAGPLLIDLANLRGGPDNITALIVRVHAGTPDGAAPAADPRPWYRRYPWPYAALFLGAVLACGAVLNLADRSLALLCFVLSVVAILLGGAGLFLFHVIWDAQESERPPWRPRLKTYASCSCRVDRSLLDKLVGTLTSLEQLVRAKGWDADWHDLVKHKESAEGLLGREDLPGAFREYCRALRPLTSSLHKHRTREDVVQVVWEKAHNK